MLALHKLDFTKGTLADNLESVVVLRSFAGTEETEEVCFRAAHARRFLLLASVGYTGVLHDSLELLGTGKGQSKETNMAGAIVLPAVSVTSALNTVTHESADQLSLQLGSVANAG